MSDPTTPAHQFVRPGQVAPDLPAPTTACSAGRPRPATAPAPTCARQRSRTRSSTRRSPPSAPPRRAETSPSGKRQTPGSAALGRNLIDREFARAALALLKAAHAVMDELEP
jgi:hypothetical protein